MKKQAKQNLLCFLLLLNSFTCLNAVNNLRLTDIRCMGMGANGVTGTALFNPALLSLSESNSIHINYFNRYGMKELGNITGSLYLPNDILSFGLNISSFGYDAYRESMFRIPVAKQLSKKVSLGISFQYSLLQTELLEENVSQLSTDIGVVYSPVNSFLMGLLIMNLPSVLFGDKSIMVEDFKAYLIQVGFQWKVINNMLISATMENNDEHALTGSLGIEYKPFNDFSIRMGIKGKPFNPSFGIGYSFSSFTIDIAAVYHSVLGISSGVGLLFSF